MKDKKKKDKLMDIPVVKNELYEMMIDDLGSNGEGIGRIDGFAIFVEGGLPGERVKVAILQVKKSYGYGKIIEIIKRSPDRVAPRCGVAKYCGGCQLQHLSYEGQLMYKTKKVKDELERIGGQKDVIVQPILGMEDPWRYRNKAQFPVGAGKEGAEIGFFSKRSHHIVDTDVCLLQDACNDEITAVVRAYMAEYNVPAYHEGRHDGIIRHVLTRIGRNSGEIMVCIVVNGKKIPHSHELVEKLKAIEGVASVVMNENRQRTNVILGRRVTVLWGKETITDSIDGIQFEISPLSFYQVNPAQTEVLYKKALELADLTGEETVLDLYCGIGTISLFFARKAKTVCGVEIVEEAVNDARRNAEKNGMTNVTFEVGAADDVVAKMFRNRGVPVHVVVVDPPRKGCEPELLETIVSLAPEKVIYVSCNPATLARDLIVLCEAGYQVREVQPVDQFPMTVHVECVVKLCRADK